MPINPLKMFTFDTGAATLPDAGILSYNTIQFSSLFHSKLRGRQIYDEAQRTVKAMEYTLEVEGVVTLGPGDIAIDTRWFLMRVKLSQAGGYLRYEGRGAGPIIINGADGIKDIAWGPKPQILDFQPLGNSASAMCRWECKFTVPELIGHPSAAAVVQFNSEISISYDDEGYSHLDIRGTLEIPLTRTGVNVRTMATTVDDYRQKYLDKVADSFDLTRFRVTRRQFTISRDRRTMQWEFQAEELPYMGLPTGCLSARGSFSVRPKEAVTVGGAVFNWMCSLRCTYSVASSWPRRVAWFHFISLLRYRMQWSSVGVIPGVGAPSADPNIIPGEGVVPPGAIAVPPAAAGGARGVIPVARGVVAAEGAFATELKKRKAWLVHFEIDEGLYLDSRRTTFGATWVLMCTLPSLLQACGMWRWPGGPNGRGTDSAGFDSRRLWAVNMKGIQRSQSWLGNRIDATQDVIVDMGGP